MNSDKLFRIAAASTDGKMIDRHFGKADSFFIFDIDASGWTFVEQRNVTPLCESCDEDGGHSSILESLADCTAVVAVKIGAKAKRDLEINHISAFEQPDHLDKAMAKLAAYYTGKKTLKNV